MDGAADGRLDQSALTRQHTSQRTKPRFLVQRVAASIFYGPTPVKHADMLFQSTTNSTTNVDWCDLGLRGASGGASGLSGSDISAESRAGLEHLEREDGFSWSALAPSASLEAWLGCFY